MQDFAKIFKAYDVRGIYPSQIDEDTAEIIGRAYAAIRKPKIVAIGKDVRSSGESLKPRLIKGLIESGVDVVDIGTITTDQLYFAVGEYGYDGGISITASHNPAEYNGFKFAEKGGSPISSEDLLALRDWATTAVPTNSRTPGKLSKKEVINGYIIHVSQYIDQSNIKPLKIVANANYGAVGRTIDKLADPLKWDVERLNWQEDGSFPKGTPNPLLSENRAETSALIKKVKPDLGVAWDSDADRCFLFTGDGMFVPSPFIIALLSSEVLKNNPGAKIVHDITSSWVIDDAVKKAGGTPVVSRTGHTFIKQSMRVENAPFGGESSGHYFFKDSFYADNGIAPLLMIVGLMTKSGLSLRELIQPLMDKYKLSDETNFPVKDTANTLKKIEAIYGNQGKVDKTDGLTIDSEKWRFNIRPSNTEPLIRLNAEAYNQQELDKIIIDVQKFVNT